MANLRSRKGKRNSNYRHGMSGTRFYHIWQDMIDRIKRPTNHAYKNYGGRGIKVCKRWISHKGFINFYNDMIPTYKKTLTIDRINNNGNYCKENCRWITKADQSKNRRDNIKYKGEIMADACKRLGGKKLLIFDRLNSGWSKKRAFTTPIIKTRVRDKEGKFIKYKNN